MSKPRIGQERIALAIASALVTMAVVPGCDRAQEDRAAAAAAKAVHDANRALKSAGDVAREGAREAGRALGDAGITTMIKTALLADKGVNGAGINVDTNGGKVTLTGNLPDQAQADRALEIARGVEGVKAVENRLTVGSGTAASRS